jgi:hypothetical protein
MYALDTERPQLVFRGRLLKPQLNRQGGKRVIVGTARWRWKIRYNGSMRSIVCSKLVWMYWHKCLVTEGCVIHHGDKGRLWDGISNLEEKTDEQHKQYHYGAELSSSFD